MNYNTACFYLEIEKSDFHMDMDAIRKKYKILALKYHPDKNPNCLESKERFLKVKESYDFLEAYLDIHKEAEKEEKEENENENEYTQLLFYFLNNYASPFLNKIISKIMLDIHSISDIEPLDKDSLWEIYHFLQKHKHILHLDESILVLIRSLIINKYKNDTFLFLNPSIEDLLEGNLYKLHLNDKMYIIPLWHNELYYDLEDENENKKGELIVYCDPEIKESHLFVNENNELEVELSIPFETSLLEKTFIDFLIGKKQFHISVANIFIKPLQYIRLKGMGIPKMNENDMYDESQKHDLIVKLKFS